ncbi:hypothetical protein OG21DRAFT_903792 [Imleria badia]|nr:hypothetical protein OG21DRAFT_903792 [Imleria badia]
MNLRRELTRYTSRLNDWLTRDVQDRQAELRGVTARVDQLREDLGHLDVGAGPGWRPAPPVVPYPTPFFPQGDPQPGMDWPPSAHSPDARWGMSDPSPYGEYHPTGPNQYVDHIEELDERVIPSTPSSGSCSPPPVLGRGRMFVPPSPSHDSRSPTPTQESYHPPRQQPMRSESAPPAHAFETSSHAPPPPAPLRVARVHIPPYRHRAPSPPRDLDEPEITHPIISSQPIDDGWIPRADSRASCIQLPPPHELRQSIPPNSSSAASEVRDSRPSARMASHKGRVHDPVTAQPPPIQTTREHRDATPHMLTPFNLLSVNSKRNQTVSAASLDVYDSNTATNTVVGSPDHSAVSQTQPLPAIIPPDDRDPLAVASEWREREEIDWRQRRAHRIR